MRKGPEEVGQGHVNRARMQLSRRGLHARALISSGHCLVLFSCNCEHLRTLQVARINVKDKRDRLSQAKTGMYRDL